MKYVPMNGMPTQQPKSTFVSATVATPGAKKCFDIALHFNGLANAWIFDV